MQKFQCLLLVLKQPYICYYKICMNVPLISLNGYMIYDETYNASMHQRFGAR